jgi:hypothetical protein
MLGSRKRLFRDCLTQQLIREKGSGLFTWVIGNCHNKSIANTQKNPDANAFRLIEKNRQAVVQSFIL